MLSIGRPNGQAVNAWVVRQAGDALADVVGLVDLPVAVPLVAHENNFIAIAVHSQVVACVRELSHARSIWPYSPKTTITTPAGPVLAAVESDAIIGQPGWVAAYYLKVGNLQSPPFSLTRGVVLDVNVPNRISLVVAPSRLAGGVDDLGPIRRPTGLLVLRVVGDGVSVTSVGVHCHKGVPTTAVPVGYNDSIAAEIGLACLFIKKPLVAAINVGDVKVIGRWVVKLVIDGEKDLASEP